jgi:hypothetical protein
MLKARSLLLTLMMAATMAILVATAAVAAFSEGPLEVEQVCCDYSCEEYCVYPKKTCVRDDDCRCAWPWCYPYTCCPAALED